MREERALESWLEALETRHLADLRFSEVTRALRALSADYVQRRERVRHAALDGRGKRAAFALFYGPLHFLTCERICRALEVSRARIDQVIDLGCGTGGAGAAAAFEAQAGSIVGIDRHAWAVEEAAWTYRHFGLRHRVYRNDVARALASRRLTAAGSAGARTLYLAAYTANELTEGERDTVLQALLDRAADGAAALIVEPIARGIAPWWPRWSDTWRTAGGRVDEWRFREPLPGRVRAFDHAAGLDHREQTARSLWISNARA